MRAIAIVDGEHYPEVVRAALEELPYDFVGVMFVGGSEKLRGAPDYGVPVVEDAGGAEIAVDLSDEPVLSPARRFELASPRPDELKSVLSRLHLDATVAKAPQPTLRADLTGPKGKLPLPASAQR